MRETRDRINKPLKSTNRLTNARTHTCCVILSMYRHLDELRLYGEVTVRHRIVSDARYRTHMRDDRSETIRLFVLSTASTVPVCLFRLERKKIDEFARELRVFFVFIGLIAKARRIWKFCECRFPGTVWRAASGELRATH